MKDQIELLELALERNKTPRRVLFMNELWVRGVKYVDLTVQHVDVDMLDGAKARHVDGHTIFRTQVPTNTYVAEHATPRRRMDDVVENTHVMVNRGYYHPPRDWRACLAAGAVLSWLLIVVVMRVVWG